jgi:hypothetical protein
MKREDDENTITRLFRAADSVVVAEWGPARAGALRALTNVGSAIGAKDRYTE